MNMNAPRRYLLVSGVLLATSAPPSAMIAHSYGRDRARRFALGMVGTLTVQQALLAWVLVHHARSHRTRAHKLTVVDAITLSRGAVSAALVGLMIGCIRDRRGPAGWWGWVALLYGSILCDWLDGPVARRLGTSELGSLFDLEADSWLTLCTAGSAVAWGGLPITVITAPVLRYVLMFRALQSAPYSELFVDEPRWVRTSGIMQMLLFIAALAPFGGRFTRALVHTTYAMQTPMQVAALLILHMRRGRRQA